MQVPEGPQSKREGVMRFYTREIPSILATAVVTSAIWLISGAVSKIIDDDNNEKLPCCPCINTKANDSGEDDPRKEKSVVKSPKSAAPVITYDSLVENLPSSAFKDPETLDEACDALKDGDLAYYSVGKVLKLVRNSVYAKRIPVFSYGFDAIEDLGSVAATCSLTEDKVMEILRAGIDQGDIEIGHMVMDMAENACSQGDMSTLGHHILQGEWSNRRLEECEPLPLSTYLDCIGGVDVEKCFIGEFGDDGSLEDCLQRVTKECDGLDDSFSPRSDCEASLAEEFGNRLSDRQNQCVSGHLAEMGIDPDDVKPLADIKEAKLFAEAFKAVFIDEPGLPKDLKSESYIWDLLLSDFDFDNPEVRDALGISDYQGFIDKYVVPSIDFAEEILLQVEDPFYLSEMIEDLKEMFEL